jgi:hypothetical protein
MLEAAGAIVGVAVGLGLTFLATSLLVTAIVELTNSIFASRAKNLKAGVMRLCDDPNFTGLAKMLYEHPRVSPLGGTKGVGDLPNRIDSTQFAKALLDVTGLSELCTPASAEKTPPELASALDGALGSIINPKSRQLLRGTFQRSAGDANKIESEIASWFDLASDRIYTGFETRNLLGKFNLALLFAVLFNVSAVNIVSVLYEQLTEKVTSTQTLNDAEIHHSKIGYSAHPIGWSDGHLFEVIEPREGGWMPLWLLPGDISFEYIVGYLITAIMAVVGAPFWVDIFQKLIGVKIPLLGSDKDPKS